MHLPEYFLPRPPLNLTPRKRLAFEALRQCTPPGAIVDYRLPYPKWQYLFYLSQTDELVLHGSQHRDLAVVEPRAARDVLDFNSQQAIYATADGLWVMYFAILDRLRFPGMTLFNSCLSVRSARGKLREPVYFFSVSESARRYGPWCDGMVYVLSRRSFHQEPPRRVQGMEIICPHWISVTAQEPVARLPVSPQDFPFLAQIHGHDDVKLGELFASDPAGFPARAVVA